MYPAPSIVLFTTAAGAGYGLLFLLGLALPLGLLPAARPLGVVGLGLAFALIGFGLAASMFHLGHPERAWRALSQWRSSWLSREGVVSLLTFVPAGLFAVGWVVLGTVDGLWVLFALFSAVGAAATVFCTGMIYASLKPIRQWHDPWVVPLYLAFAAATGALWLVFLAHLFLLEAPGVDLATLAALPLCWGFKFGYWQRIDRATGVATPESATGLGRIGRVRLLERPHSEENYLLREMGYRVARKHVRKLRRLAVVFGLALPAALVVLALVLSGGPATLAALLAAVSGSLGALIERWLFFAEATHTVMLYYGAEAA